MSATLSPCPKLPFTKFYLLTLQGEATLTNEDADEKEAGLGPKKVVTATLDLFEHIEEGACWVTWPALSAFKSVDRHVGRKQHAGTCACLCAA